MRKQSHIYSIDVYAYQSPLRKYDPVLKVLFSLLLLVLCLAENKITVSVCLLVSMLVLNVWKNRVGLWEYLKLLGVPLVFILLGCAAIAAEAGRGPEGWYLHVTGESVRTAAETAVRTLGCVSILYFLALSTPVWEIASVLRRFKVPKLMTELMNMIYRYLFILMDVQFRLKNSAESRLGYQDFSTSCYTFGSSIGSLFILSLKKAGMYYDAMEARGYDGELKFLEEEKKNSSLFFLAGAAYLAFLVIVGRIS